MEYFIADWTLVPASGGVFDVRVNDELIFSKKQIGRHAEPGEIKALLDDKIAAYKAQHRITWQQPPKS